jgi:Na+:H+ antiporter
VIPFAAGLGFGLLTGEDAGTSMFLAAALVATSVGITSALLIELGVLEHRASRTILGAAIVDDILAMILLAVAGGIAGSRLDPWSIAVTVLLALGFVAFFALGGTRLTAGARRSSMRRASRSRPCCPPSSRAWASRRSRARSAWRPSSARSLRG